MRINVLARAGLAAIVVFQGCASSLPKEPPLLLSQSGDGVAVHADPPDYANNLAGVTWVRMRVENRGKRYMRVRSSDIRLELADGQRFPPMPPEVALEKVVEQVQQWDRAQPPSYGSEIFSEEIPAETAGSPQHAESTARPSGTRAESPPFWGSPEHPILKGLEVATCGPAAGVKAGFFPALVFLPPCLAVVGVGYAVGHRTILSQGSAAMRRFRLGEDLEALRDVELSEGETATTTLPFPVATVVVRSSPRAALTVPFVDSDGKEIVLRLLLTTTEQ